MLDKACDGVHTEAPREVVARVELLDSAAPANTAEPTAAALRRPAAVVWNAVVSRTLNWTGPTLSCNQQV